MNNYYPKPSLLIAGNSASKFLDAGRYSFDIKKPFTLYVVIRLGEYEEGNEFKKLYNLRAFVHSITRWFREQRKADKDAGQPDRVGEPLWAWTIENEEHLHANLLLHLPDHLTSEFHRLCFAWAEKAFGSIGPDDLRCKSIWGLDGLLRYVLKGVDPEATSWLPINHEPQGEVWGTRTSACRALGPVARKKHAARSRTIQAALSKSLTPSSPVSNMVSTGTP